MNIESSMRAVPPPIPESAKKKGPPPIPEAAMKKGPPPIPAEALKKGPPPIPMAERRKFENLQDKDVVEAFEVPGFAGLDIVATLEKKEERKGKAENKNEDNLIIDPETGLVGVLDGLGGEGKGDLASKAAERAIPEAFKALAPEIGKMDGSEIQKRLVEQQLAKLGNPELRPQVTEMIEGILSSDPKIGKKALALVEAVRAANAAVKETGGKTTATVGMVHEAPDGKRYAIVAGLGDSPAFKRRANGEVVQIIEEDSALNGLTRAGFLKPEMLAEMKQDPDKKIDIPLNLTVIQALGGGEEQLKQFEAKGVKSIPMNYKGLKRAMVASLGSEVFEPTLAVRRLDEGDELIIGTDIFDNFEDQKTDTMDGARINASMQGKTQKERLNNLRKASKVGAKDDDAAIVIVKPKSKTS